MIDHQEEEILEAKTVKRRILRVKTLEEEVASEEKAEVASEEAEVLSEEKVEVFILQDITIENRMLKILLYNMQQNFTNLFCYLS